jgi:hypothetical protein
VPTKFSHQHSPTPPNAAYDTNYGARAAFSFLPFALVCLACLSFPALLRAVNSSLAVHAASRASVSPSDTALEISLLSVLTTRFWHAFGFDLMVRQFAIALKPVVEMLVVLIGGDPSRPQARAPRTLNQLRHRLAPSVAWQASMLLQCECKSSASASRRPG